MGSMTAERAVARRKDVAVKIDAEVVRDAKIVAAYKDISLAEYMSELIRPLVARDLEQEHSKRISPKSKPKGAN